MSYNKTSPNPKVVIRALANQLIGYSLYLEDENVTRIANEIIEQVDIDEKLQKEKDYPGGISQRKMNND